MPKGSYVLVRTTGGRPAVRQVWEVRPTGVLVVHEAYYRRWLEHPHISPLAFSIPSDSVFKHDPDLFEQLDAVFNRARQSDEAAGTQLRELWAQAIPFSA